MKQNCASIFPRFTLVLSLPLLSLCKGVYNHRSKLVSASFKKIKSSTLLVLLKCHFSRNRFQMIHFIDVVTRPPPKAQAIPLEITPYWDNHHPSFFSPFPNKKSLPFPSKLVEIGRSIQLLIRGPCCPDLRRANSWHSLTTLVYRCSTITRKPAKRLDKGGRTRHHRSPTSLSIEAPSIRRWINFPSHLMNIEWAISPCPLHFPICYQIMDLNSLFGFLILRVFSV